MPSREEAFIVDHHPMAETRGVVGRRRRIGHLAMAMKDDLGKALPDHPEMTAETIKERMGRQCTKDRHDGPNGRGREGERLDFCPWLSNSVMTVRGVGPSPTQSPV
jgi:hypothetical protein